MNFLEDEMNDKADNRRIFLWNRNDLLQNTNALADAVAEVAIEELFVVNNEVVLLIDGKCVRVDKHILKEFLTKKICSVRPVCHDDGKWAVERYSFAFEPNAPTEIMPDEMTLIRLLTAGRAREEGSLYPRLAIKPTAPVDLTAQQKIEVVMRLRSGEPPRSIAKAYRTDIATVQQLAQGARS
jgi:hypothetical protein